MVCSTVFLGYPHITGVSICLGREPLRFYTLCDCPTEKCSPNSLPHLLPHPCRGRPSGLGHTFGLPHGGFGRRGLGAGRRVLPSRMAMSKNWLQDWRSWQEDVRKGGTATWVRSALFLFKQDVRKGARGNLGSYCLRFFFFCFPVFFFLN